MRHHSSASAKAWMRWLECCRAFRFWEPSHLQLSSISHYHVTLLRIVTCVWHCRLQFGKLAPDGNIHETHYCDTKACSFSKLYVHARCLLQYYRACYVIEVLIFWSSHRCFLCLCTHNSIYTYYMYNTALYTYYKHTFIYTGWFRRNLHYFGKW